MILSAAFFVFPAALSVSYYTICVRELPAIFHPLLFFSLLFLYIFIILSDFFPDYKKIFDGQIAFFVRICYSIFVTCKKQSGETSL